MKGGTAPGRILLIKFGAVGDALLTTPAVRALKATWPESRLTALAMREAAQVYRGNPHVDEVIVLEEPPGLRGMTYLWRYARATALRARLREGAFDLAVDFESSYKSCYVALFGKVRRRAGFRLRGRRGYLNPLYQVRVPHPTGAFSQVKRYVGLIEALGGAPRGFELEFRVEPDAQARMDAWLARQGAAAGWLAVAPASKAWTKRWPLESYRTLCREARRRWGWRTLVAWGPGEEEEVRGLAGEEGAALAPPTSLEELGALFRRCRVVVSNDSAPFHLAAAVGAPVVGLFGPTDPQAWAAPSAPGGLAALAERVPCHPCNEFFRCRQGAHLCMTSLDSGRVIREIEGLTHA